MPDTAETTGTCAYFTRIMPSWNFLMKGSMPFAPPIMKAGMAASRSAPAENGPPGAPSLSDVGCHTTTPRYCCSARSMARVRPSMTSGPMVFIFVLNETMSTSSCPGVSSTHRRTASFSSMVLPNLRGSALASPTSDAGNT